MLMIEELQNVPCKCCNLEDDCFLCETCSLVTCLDCCYYDEDGKEICSYCAQNKVDCRNCQRKIDKECMVKCGTCRTEVCMNCVEQDSLGILQCSQCYYQVLIEENPTRWY